MYVTHLNLKLFWDEDKARIEVDPVKQSPTYKRAGKIKFPAFALDDMPLVDAVKYYNELVAKADPKKKGIRLALPDPLPKVLQEARMTMQVSGKSAADIAELIASLSGTELSWTAEGVMLTVPTVREIEVKFVGPRTVPKGVIL
jgi:hypothetical protein